MTRKGFLPTAFAAAVVAGVGGMRILPSSGLAQSQRDEDELRIIKGFAIAPVPLNLTGKNLNLVGLGSYIVNAQGDCNGCHSAGPPPSTRPREAPTHSALLLVDRSRSIPRRTLEEDGTSDR
jgi:hypothetical protein